MAEESTITTVNEHYLEKVMDLAEASNVEATEDIFDARGMKLVAKGAQISRGLQEKLILHKLKKPLESSITVEGAVDINAIMKEAERIADTNAPVVAIFKVIGNGGPSPLKILADARYGSAMAMMLTVIERGGPAALTHCVMVSLVALCLGKKLGLTDGDLTAVALAGLLHDIGELYIEPEYVSSKRRLLPHEWRHVVVHPRIGQMLVSELDNFPPAVARALSEHHERYNGTGYPRQLKGNEISLIGQTVSAAEMIAGVFMRPERSLELAELAMKIIPGEHSHPIVSVISSALRTQQGPVLSADSFPAGEIQTKVGELFQGISSALSMGGELLLSPAIESQKAKNLLEQSMAMTHIVKRAFSSTGLDSYLKDSHAPGTEASADIQSDIHFELSVATREIQWRMRDVARNLALHSAAFSPAESAAMQPLIQLLDRG